MAYFQDSPNCPFCERPGRRLFEVSYYQTAERNPALPDVEGAMLKCESCGVGFPSLSFSPAAFELLYAKSLSDLRHFDDSALQRVRRSALAGLIRSQRANPLSTALQIPLHASTPKRLLDVGCGFGEFSKAYRQLGTEVTGTEIIPELVERVRAAGIECHLGELVDLKLADRFDLILFRAVLYRTGNPVGTLRAAKDMLADGGHISVLDPCVDAAGARYFAIKHFPQGRYYILDFPAYARMLRERFGLTVVKMRQLYGRPNAPLKKVRFWGNVTGFAELVWNNLTGRKPYMAAYLLKPDR